MRTIDSEPSSDYSDGLERAACDIAKQEAARQSHARPDAGLDDAAATARRLAVGLALLHCCTLRDKYKQIELPIEFSETCDVMLSMARRFYDEKDKTAFLADNDSREVIRSFEKFFSTIRNTIGVDSDSQLPFGPYAMNTVERTAFAAGGGASCGFASVGAIRVIGDKRIPINMIGGGSMGSAMILGQSAFAERNGTVPKKHADFVERVVKASIAYELSREESDGTMRFAVDKLCRNALKMKAITQEEFEYFMKQTPQTPTWIRVAKRLYGPMFHTKFLQLDSDKPMSHHTGRGGLIEASTANRIFGFNAVKHEEHGILHDDYSVVLFSIAALVEKLRSELARDTDRFSTVIGSPVGAINNKTLLAHVLRLLRDRISRSFGRNWHDGGDVVYSSKNYGPHPGLTFGTYANKVDEIGHRSRRFPWRTKVAVPGEMFIEMGARAAHDSMLELDRWLGLQPMVKS